MTESDTPGLAAVDLGSNSFHMIIARLQGDEPVTVDRIREQVQLAENLDAEQCITAEAWERVMRARKAAANLKDAVEGSSGGDTDKESGYTDSQRKQLDRKVGNVKD